MFSSIKKDEVRFMQYKAVIFDLDGTLIDSLADLADSANIMLTEYGYPTHEVEDYRLMVGNGSRMLMKRCLPKDVSEEFIDEALAKYKNIYESRFLEKTRSYDGILELLKELKADAIPLAICTNKHNKAAHTIVEVLFEKQTFDYLIGEREGIPRKPDPTSALEIAQDMKIRPEEIVYIGDSMIDMKTALNANMLPVGVLWGFRDQKELEENGAKVLLEHPAELLEKIEFIKN